MKQYRWIIIAVIFCVFAIALFLQGPIPQDMEYHNYADQRTIFGIPNFWDVVSNIPFFFLGLYGTIKSFKHISERPGLVTKLIPIFLCVGIFIACFGSCFYHLNPTNFRLVWDRLPMTFMFMPLFSLLIYDFLGKKEGELAFWILMPLGMLSVFYWQYTESIGQGDLRLYAFVQYFPLAITPFILWLFPKKTNYIKYIWAILAWYFAAKFCEHFDREIYDLLGFWSGHTIKHLLGGLTLFYALKLVFTWEKETLLAGR